MNNLNDPKKVLMFINESPDALYSRAAADYFSVKLKDPKILSIVLNHSDVYLPRFVKLLKIDDESIAEKAFIGCINIASVTRGSEAVVKLLSATEKSDGIIRMIWSRILSTEKSTINVTATALMSNLTRNESYINDILSFSPPIEEIIEYISFQLMDNYSNKSEIRQYFSSLLLNLTTLLQVRKCLVDREKSLLWLITPLLNIQQSDFDNKCLFGIIKNLTFDTDSHNALFEEYRILGKLLHVLAGNEVYSDEDSNKLPEEVRYMLPNKTRNPDKEIRFTVLETLYQLGATTYGREFMRSRNAYIILRDYHKWEEENECLNICEDVVNLLIRTEEEIGVNNIRAIETPEEDLPKSQKFQKMG